MLVQVASSRNDKILVKRSFNAERLNEIVNDPSVFPWVCGAHTAPLDTSVLIKNKRNYLLMGEHGGVMFLQLQPGLYDAHTQVLPAGRGAWTLGMVQAALHYMFTRTDAIELVTRVPKGNLGARALTRAIHGQKEFTIQKGWVFKGDSVPADIYSLTVHTWMRTTPDIEKRGHWFHAKLTKEFARHKYEEPPHDDDPVHDRYVGIAVDMIMGGQHVKGVVLYNRWAQIAGYEPIKIVMENPLVLDIKNALVRINRDDFWVMTCR